MLSSVNVVECSGEYVNKYTLRGVRGKLSGSGSYDGDGSPLSKRCKETAAIAQATSGNRKN